MPRPIVDRSAEVAAIVKRADAARIQHVTLCRAAGVHPTTISRSISSGRMGIETIGKLEKALHKFEAERVTA